MTSRQLEAAAAPKARKANIRLTAVNIRKIIFRTHVWMLSMRVVNDLVNANDIHLPPFLQFKARWTRLKLEEDAQGNMQDVPENIGEMKRAFSTIHDRVCENIQVEEEDKIQATPEDIIKAVADKTDMNPATIKIFALRETDASYFRKTLRVS